MGDVRTSFLVIWSYTGDQIAAIPMFDDIRSVSVNYEVS